jgi:iron(III) transport system substrate-binding protein
MFRISSFIKIAAISSLLFGCGGAGQEEVVNVYTHRHYEADNQLYKKFTDETGIKVNVINANADELIQRLESEGANSPADVLITVDGGRLNRAMDKGLLQSVESEILEQNVPDQFREPQGHWFGLTYRARIIVHAKDRIPSGAIRNYEDLSDPKWKGKILVRSSEHVYNQSLTASIILADGEEKATEWAKGLVANFARTPKGNDRDQVKAIAAGEGDIAIVNSYYIGLMLTSENEEEKKAGQGVELVFPNQDNRGTHINISAAGVTKTAPNKENAIRFIEFLSSATAQGVFAGTNYEYPTNPSIPFSELLQSWGAFKKDSANVSLIGRNNEKAVLLMEKAGWK